MNCSLVYHNVAECSRPHHLRSRIALVSPEAGTYFLCFVVQQFLYAVTFCGCRVRDSTAS